MLQSLIEIIESPVKSLIASLIGTVMGYVPTAFMWITGVIVTPPAHYLQIIVWIATTILAITSVVSWVQKQIDRYHEKKNN